MQLDVLSQEETRDNVLETKEDGDEIKIVELKKKGEQLPAIKILVSCHKSEIVVQNDIICPIAVGADNGNKTSFEMRDNDGEDNISHLNARFCELTAQYWAYKNLKSDYYGFFHYRRYMSFRHFDTKCNINVPGIYNNIEQDFGLNESDIRQVLDGVDLLVPVQIPVGSNYNQYKAAHDIKDLEFCLRYISQKYPEYNGAVQRYMKDTNGYFYNVFVATKEIFFEYCNWLFDILMAFDNQKDYSDLDTYSIRTAGFLGERLFGVYVTHLKMTRPKLKIVHAPVVFIKNTHDNTPHVAKTKYKQSIGTSALNCVLPRGSRRREFCKKIYKSVFGKK